MNASCPRPGGHVARCRGPGWVAGALLLVSAVAAAAGPVPPSYDVVALCRSGGGQAAEAECLAAEERARHALDRAYASIPPRVSARCERLGRQRTGGVGSYAFLEGCLDLK